MECLAWVLAEMLNATIFANGVSIQANRFSLSSRLKRTSSLFSETLKLADIIARPQYLPKI